MNAPWDFTRFLPMAARLIGRGRLPTLLFAVAAKGASQGLTWRVATHDDDALRAHLPCGECGQLTHRAIADHQNGGTRIDACCIGCKPARSHDIRQGQ